MEQLKMLRFSEPVLQANLPQGYKIVSHSENLTKDWAYITQELNGGKLVDEEEFNIKMLKDPKIVPERIFYVLNPEGKGAATATACIEKETGIGTMHMVATLPQYKGLGLGGAVCAWVVKTFEDMQISESNLLTDGFRIPAIKIYLKLSYKPFLFLEDMPSRWLQVKNDLGLKTLECYDADKKLITI